MSSSLPPSWLIYLLVHFAQATLFGLMIVTLLLALPLVSARTRHLLGWIGLAKFIVPLGLLGLFLPLRYAIPWSQTWLPMVVTGGLKPIAGASPSAFLVGWELALIIWIVGTATLTVLATFHFLRYRRDLRCETEPFVDARQRLLANLARRSGLNPERVAGWATQRDCAPCVSGFFRSSIHVPSELLRTLSPEETEAVLLHELAHIARRDNLWRILQTCMVCLCWFHPLVWWLHRRLILESEQACDERVLALTRDHEAYASGLVKAAHCALGLNMPLFAGMAQSDLQRRLRIIIKSNPTKDHPMFRTLLLLTALAGFVLTAGAIAPAAPDKPVSALDQFPVPIIKIQPTYPADLLASKVEGEAQITFVVDSGGAVRDAKIISATRPEFGAAALLAVEQWTFQPGLHGGRKVNTRLTVPIVFSLPKK